MRPWTNTVIRRARRNTRSMSWSMSSTPISAGSRSISAMTSPVSLDGTPADGSTSSSTLGQLGHLDAVDQDLPGARRQPAADQFDEGGLAGAVRADQRLAGAAFEAEIDRIGDGQRAEAFAQTAGFQRRRLRRHRHLDAH